MGPAQSLGKVPLGGGRPNPPTGPHDLRPKRPLCTILCGGRTRFQRDWDFLTAHATRALERYWTVNLPLLGTENHLRGQTELSAWRQAEALALYVRNWKTRIPRHGLSSHPVDALVYSFQEMLEQLPLWPCLSAAQWTYLSGEAPFTVLPKKNGPAGGGAVGIGRWTD